MNNLRYHHTTFFLLIFSLLCASQVIAHPGRTDSSGGHSCRTNCSKWGYSSGEYHYHGSGYSNNKSSTYTTPSITPSNRGIQIYTHPEEPTISKPENESKLRIHKSIEGKFPCKIYLKNDEVMEEENCLIEDKKIFFEKEGKRYRVKSEFIKKVVRLKEIDKKGGVK